VEDSLDTLRLNGVLRDRAPPHHTAIQLGLSRLDWRGPGVQATPASVEQTPDAGPLVKEEQMRARLSLTLRAAAVGLVLTALSLQALLTPRCKNWATPPCHKDRSFTATPVDSIASVSVTFALTDGSTRRATSRPQEAEAVFLTMSAVDKLLIPYYTMIYGVDY